MTFHSLKSLLSYLVENAIVSQDKQSTVYNFVQKRLAKIGTTSVSYELSDTQSIIVSRDATTYLYSVEIITAVTAPQESVQPVAAPVAPAALFVEPQVVVPSEPVQPVAVLVAPAALFVEPQVVIPSEPIQFTLNLHCEIDLVKFAAYFKQHKKPRKLKIIDNTPSPQLAFNFDLPAKKTNVVLFGAVRQGKSVQMKNVA